MHVDWGKTIALGRKSVLWLSVLLSLCSQSAPTQTCMYSWERRNPSQFRVYIIEIAHTDVNSYWCSDWPWMCGWMLHGSIIKMLMYLWFCCHVLYIRTAVSIPKLYCLRVHSQPCVKTIHGAALVWACCVPVRQLNMELQINACKGLWDARTQHSGL